YEVYKETADWLRARTAQRPKVAIICGSGLGGLADVLENKTVFLYEDIPHFPRSTVAGHVGRLVFGELKAQPCLCMQGRFHCYEGYSVSTVTFPIRVFFLLGVEVLIVTNAAGGLNPHFQVGDIMFIRDHISMFGLGGQNPLQGPNDERLLILLLTWPAILSAKETHCCLFLSVPLSASSSSLSNLVNCCISSLGSSTAVSGMSTVPEVIVARHCGLRVLGISLITNKAVMSYNSQEKANHEEVLRVSVVRAEALQKLVTHLLGKLGEST
ncbi:PNPH phosphorylase, partial [Nyctiprogne leucopyga]|nr:PNPH phosphorylase [Nyctiprogne leucopyga]